jgi:transcriptional regulator with XRE-family HTH domain
MKNLQEARYANIAPIVPEWTLADRLAKTRQFLGLNQKEFGKLTSLTTRQIQFAESGIAIKNQELIVTVYAFKSGVDYEWIKTGNAPENENGGPDGGQSLLGLDSNQEPIGSSTLPGLDSNQEPFGSFLAYQIRRLERGRGLKYLERAA